MPEDEHILDPTGSEPRPERARDTSAEGRMHEVDDPALHASPVQKLHAPADSARPGALGPNEGAPRKRRWWVIALLVLLAVGLVALFMRKPAPSKSATSAEKPAVPSIKVATSRTGDIGIYVEALGTVTPLAMVNLYSQVNGRITAVHYTEGQIVHRGDPLIDIDPRPYEAQLAEAQGTLVHDQGVLAQAEMDLKRYKEASDKLAISRQIYEDQVLLVEQYRGTVQNDLGQVQYAQVQLSYCHLASPINGRVGLRLVDPGNVIFSGASNSLVVITQLQPVTVVFNVPEDNLEEMRGELTRRHSLLVDVFDRSQERKLASGKLLTLDNLVDTSTGTVRFRGQFENADLRLFPNQFVNARLLVKTLHDAVLVPSAAVQRNGTQAFVYVIANGVAKTREVTELTSEADVAAVDGVRAGEVVSSTGFDKLEDGTHVNVQSQQSFGASTDTAARAPNAVRARSTAAQTTRGAGGQS